MARILVGEVQIGILAPCFPRSLIVCSRRIRFDIVQAQVSGAALVLDVGDPFLSPWAPGDSYVLGRGGSGAGTRTPLAAVGVVLFGRAVTQVLPAVV